MNTINAVVIKPGLLPEYIDNVENSYHAVKSLFDMDSVFMTTYLRLSDDGLVILGDDNAKIDKLPLNRVLESDFWLGTVVVVKEKPDMDFDDNSDEYYCRMSDEEVNEIIKIFTEKYPPIEGEADFSVIVNPDNPFQQIQQLRIDGKIVQESNYMSFLPFDGDNIFSFLGI